MNKKSIVFFVAVIMGLISFRSIATDIDKEKTIQNGKELFYFFCTNCHGVNGDGKGQMADELKIVPANLAVLKRSSKVPITDRVLKALDGRHVVSEGKERNMPALARNLAISDLYEITEYIKTIQK